MKSRYLALVSVAIALPMLTGCRPSFHSYGSSLMTEPVFHRTVADETPQMEASATGFLATANGENNIAGGGALGGVANFTYRMGGKLSPVFFSGSVGFFAGQVRFGCTMDPQCFDEDNSEYVKYREWLSSDEGLDEYSIRELQERVLVGLDFNPGSYIFVGLAAGVQGYQGNGGYDAKVQELDELGIVDDDGGKYGIGLASAVWVGTRIGKQGQYGQVSLEFDFNPGIAAFGYKLNYAHPSGLYGGIAMETMLGASLYFGKTFRF